MPPLSIIVIAWNVRDEVLRCLASVEQHAPAEVETILVDNGSVDGTAAAVAERFPRVRVVTLPSNRGLVARNDGLRVATGERIMFLDSDALLTERAAEELLDFMDRNPAVGLVGPQLVYPDGRLQHSARRFPPATLPVLRRPPLNRLLENGPTVRRHLMHDERLDEPRAVEYVLGACQLFSAKARRAVGEIDERMFFGPDDADWCLRIREAGYVVAYDPAATVVHDYRRSSAQRPLSRASARHLAGFAYFQWKWRRRRRNLPPANLPLQPPAVAGESHRRQP